mmetsp:Transcript_14134/g.33559  ORF Transcript_14134/g.33559 Transcript_14134/m.33559 type:complete len:90 (-) Transcript_14134:1198-1467(-)
MRIAMRGTVTAFLTTSIAVLMINEDETDEYSAKDESKEGHGTLSLGQPLGIDLRHEICGAQVQVNTTTKAKEEACRFIADISGQDDNGS